MDDIKLILKNIDFLNLVNNFVEVNVNNVDICKSLSDVDLLRFGIVMIGDRICFREEFRCSKYVYVFVFRRWINLKRFNFDFCCK